jgi:ADP-ribosylglycohydrolase
MNVEGTVEAAARDSVVTHPDPRCVAACILGAVLTRALIRAEVANEGDIDAQVKFAVHEYRHRIRGMFAAEGPFTDSEPELDVDEVGEPNALDGSALITM